MAHILDCFPLQWTPEGRLDLSEVPTHQLEIVALRALAELREAGRNTTDGLWEAANILVNPVQKEPEMPDDTTLQAKIDSWQVKQIHDRLDNLQKQINELQLEVSVLRLKP
jgi:hypothetical protein